LLATFMPTQLVTLGIAISSMLLLVALGAVAARLGGASMVRGAARVALWGALAMGCTALIGRVFGAVV
jgi:VIT1/CCC1 family predicted Fe2+/Mn2+ transporter